MACWLALASECARLMIATTLTPLWRKPCAISMGTTLQPLEEATSAESWGARSKFRRIRSASPEVRVTVPSSNGGLVAEIYREGEVLGREDNDGLVELRARLPAALLGKLQRHSDVMIERAR